MNRALPLLLLLSACAPTAEVCQDLMPIRGVPATLQRSGDAYRCACVTDGITVEVEPVRHGLGWERGTIWIDGHAVREVDFTARLGEVKRQRAEAEARARLEAKIAAAKATVRDTAKRATDAMKQLFK